MSITPIKVRIVKRPIIKARFVPQLPANLTGRTAIAVERNGSIYYLDLDYSKLAESLSFDPAQNVVSILRSDGVWQKTTVATLSTMIGADKPNLVAIANAATSADKLGYWSGPAQYSLTDFTGYMRTLLDDPDATTARATLGLVIGTDVQPHDAELDAIAGLVSAADRLPYFTGPGTAALTVLTPFARTLLDDADAATMRATIDAQQHDTDLDAIAALAPADNDFLQRKAGAWVNRSIVQIKTDLAINNVDNTSDADKPISTATQGALNLKADKAITVSAGTGLTGGGDLSANRSVALNAASITSLGKADTAVQPARAVNTGTGLTGGGDLSADRTIALDTASQASLAKADTAVQPGDLSTVATTGAYSDLSGKPTLGTAAATDATDYATAAQGAKADTAVQPVDLGSLAAKSKIDVPGDINATGTPSSSTYLRGDGVWAAGGGGGGGDLLAANNLSDVADAGQSRTNLAALGVIRVQTFTSSGTYTPDINLIYAVVECVGGGGGGGAGVGATGSVFAGAGGGSGGYSRKYMDATTIGASQAVTIGAGGAGGVGDADGGAGGATSFGSACTANGGGGGKRSSTSVFPLQGAGASVGTGDFTAAGTAGSGGVYSSGALNPRFPSGEGAGSIFGGGAIGVNSSATAGAANGVNASGYGGGGSGGGAYNAAVNQNGGNGSAGVVIITEFCSE